MIDNPFDIEGTEDNPLPLSIEVGPLGFSDNTCQQLEDGLIRPAIANSNPIAALAIADFFVRSAITAAVSVMIAHVPEDLLDEASERLNPRALLSMMAENAPDGEGLAEQVRGAHKDVAEIASLEEIWALTKDDDALAADSEAMLAEYNAQREREAAEKLADAIHRNAADPDVPEVNDAEAEYEATRLDLDADESTRDGSTSWDGDDEQETA